MTPGASVGDEDLPVAELLLIDDACDRFEAGWREGTEPQLAPFLAGASAQARPRLFRELLAIDLEFRLGRGEQPQPEAYRAGLPVDIDVIDEVFAAFGYGGATIRSFTGTGWPEAAPPPGTDLPRPVLSPAVSGAMRSAGYEVLGELGRGGMGVVYLARNLALNRLCAVKMILAGPHAGTATAARFRAEAEMIARLQHPDVVQIYHVGEAEGLPFLELEYLPGGSLDKRLSGTPMPPADAARLVETITRAIAQAHGEGIIHRDLKPANILLDAAGNPKVADFGLAKILDSDTGLTKSRAIVGSPSYMAPEQAEGSSSQVGAATDVYALGAVLYELLTGRPPFHAPTAMETLAQVKYNDPVPPSQVQPGLPRDLETICLHCLEKAPTRRYGTAEALAEDLRRHLAGETIRARSASIWERGLKWSRRYPALATALGVTTAAVILLLAGGFYYNARLQAALSEAVRERNFTQRNLEDLVFGLQDKLGDTSITRALRQSLLLTAISGFDDIARRTAAAKPDLSRAVAHRKLGDIFRQIGRIDDARDQYERSRRLAEKLLGEPSDPVVADCLAKAYLGLGQLSVMARPTEAKAYLQRAVELSARAESAVPSRGKDRRGLIEANFQLGRAHGFAFEFADAEVSFRKSRDLADRWLADEPQNTQASDMLASCYRKLADIRKFAKDFDGARKLYLEAISIGERLMTAEPGNTEFQEHLATALHDLAGVLSKMGKPAEARPLLERADKVCSHLVASDPESVESQARLVFVLTDLGRIARDESKFAAASESFQGAGEVLRGLMSRGKLEAWPGLDSRYLEYLRDEVDECREAPLALGPLGAIRPRPAAEAIRLLKTRARLLATRSRWPEFVAAVVTLRDLEPKRAEDLYAQARGLGLCLGCLDDDARPRPPARDRELLRQSCVERSLAALNHAAALGFHDLPRIEADETLAPIRQHPAYPELVARLKGEPPPPPRRAGQGG